jgi:hypothetical protein
MSVRERRSLWGSISTSRKVNRLSLKAALLYTWAIPHFDDEGFQEGDPQTLKARIVPLRDEIPVSELVTLVEEICAQGLWILHRIKPENRCEEVYIQDPVFDKRQSFHGIHKFPSEIKALLEAHRARCPITPDTVSDDTNPGAKRSEGKESEEKRSEEKGSEGGPRPSKRDWPKQLVEIFNSTIQYLPKVTDLSDSRLEKLRTRRKEKPDLDWWRIVFEKADIILIPGKDGKKDWYPTFDWLIKNDTNAVKVFEGNYDDAKRPPPKFSPQPGMDAWLKRKLEEEGE